MSPTAISIVSLCISGGSLGVSAWSFAWQHLRRIDSISWTVVGHEVVENIIRLQFSIANLGTRTALLRSLVVHIGSMADMSGACLVNSRLIGNTALPQPIKPGDVCCVTVEAGWNATFLSQAAKCTKAQGEDGAKLYFQAVPALWNPKGEMMVSEEVVAFVHVKPRENSMSFYAGNELTFRAKKKRRRWRERLKLKGLSPS